MHVGQLPLYPAIALTMSGRGNFHLRKQLGATGIRLENSDRARRGIFVRGVCIRRALSDIYGLGHSLFKVALGNPSAAMNRGPKS